MHMIDVSLGFCNYRMNAGVMCLQASYPARASLHQTASMAPKEPTKHQLSARLSYSQRTPAFLRKLQSRVSGVPGDDSDEDPEFEDDGSGRPPIPRRPPIPERPASDPGSGDDDRDDEAPQVVVLKEGKHLTAREVENEKRKGKLRGVGAGQHKPGHHHLIVKYSITFLLSSSHSSKGPPSAA
jgi:hypothetical protein